MLLDEIIEQVGGAMNLKHSEIIGRSRVYNLVKSRAIIVRIAQNYGYKPPDIARALQRDRTTILNMCNVFKNLYDTDKLFRKLYESIYNEEMRIKTNREQLESIVLLLGLAIQDYHAQDAISTLVLVLVKESYNKLRAKSERVYSHDWAVNLTDKEVLAMQVFLQTANIPLGYDYEQLQLQRMLDTINKKIA